MLCVSLWFICLTVSVFVKFGGTKLQLKKDVMSIHRIIIKKRKLKDWKKKNSPRCSCNMVTVRSVTQFCEECLDWYSELAIWRWYQPVFYCRKRNNKIGGFGLDHWSQKIAAWKPLPCDWRCYVTGAEVHIALAMFKQYIVQPYWE